MQLLKDLISATLFAVAALFPIVNPLGSAVIFLGLTRGYSHQVRRGLVWRITVNSFLLLAASALIGSHVLAFFGVSLPVVQVAGGLVVVSIGWVMLQQKELESQPAATNESEAIQKAFYPLTLPTTVGPGSISVAIALGANTHKHPYPWPILLASGLLGAVIIAVSVYICFRSAERLERVLGETGLSVFIRLSAFLLLCIGIQLLWNGIKALIA